MLGFNCPLAKCAELGIDFLYTMPEEMQAALFRECLLPSYGPLGGVISILDKAGGGTHPLRDWLCWYAKEHIAELLTKSMVEFSVYDLRGSSCWCFIPINQDLFQGFVLVSEVRDCKRRTWVESLSPHAIPEDAFAGSCRRWLDDAHKVMIYRR